MPRILIADDEDSMRLLVARAIAMDGHHTTTAADGAEALDLLTRERGQFDLLLTDMRMPYMGGAELAEHLRARRGTLKMICVSGYPATGTNELTSDFLAKPFSRDTLLSKVREVLDRA
jgi:CheY-like chemotaxis protein